MYSYRCVKIHRRGCCTVLSCDQLDVNYIETPNQNQFFRHYFNFKFWVSILLKLEKLDGGKVRPTKQ